MFARILALLFLGIFLCAQPSFALSDPKKEIATDDEEPEIPASCPCKQKTRPNLDIYW